MEKKINKILNDSGLKITPQRTAVLEALNALKNHPSAEQIIEYVKKSHPNVGIGTIYKTLETFQEKNILKKIKTENGLMRYDSILDHHHHLYSEKNDRIEDYYDDELNRVLEEYFDSNKIPGFEISEIKLQISGTFKNENKLN